MTSCEATNFVFDITDENKNFSYSTLSRWYSKSGAESINRLQQILKLRAENDIKLHVEDVRKRGNEIKMGDKLHKLFDLDTRKKIFEELKNVEYDDLENMAFRLDSTNTEIENILFMKYFSILSSAYTLPPGIYQISDLRLVKSSLPDDVKVIYTFDDIRLKTKLTTKK